VTLVLASGSAVRRRLLTRAGLAFVVQAADLDERALQGEEPFARGRRLAREKALAVAAGHPGAIVVGADQVGLTDEGVQLDKCWDEEAAVRQLLSMAGRAHTFVSAAAIARDGQVLAEVEEQATVRFLVFDEAVARAYVALGEWRGSAGSYHLEGRGVQLVEAVQGPDNAVYGLPLLPLLVALRGL
jgi:septum formation protein